MDIKARPTEYLGVRYRSKSEAIISRSIDLTYEPYLKYEKTYEPDWFEFKDGYTPDFFIFLADEKAQPCLSILVEYKPSMPTGVYLDRFKQRAGEYFSKNLATCLKHNVIPFFILAVGNPFSVNENIVLSIKQQAPYEIEKISIDSIIGRFMSYHSIEKAKEYRFDLEYKRYT